MTESTSSIWDDEDRVQKALEKSKRSKTWIDQSMMKIAETNKRIADEKAQEEAWREAQRKKMAREWVAATMRSQSLAVQEAQRKRREEEEANLRAKKWAESMVRNTGIDFRFMDIYICILFELFQWYSTVLDTLGYV